MSVQVVCWSMLDLSETCLNSARGTLAEKTIDLWPARVFVANISLVFCPADFLGTWFFWSVMFQLRKRPCSHIAAIADQDHGYLFFGTTPILYCICIYFSEAVEHRNPKQELSRVEVKVGLRTPRTFVCWWSTLALRMRQSSNFPALKARMRCVNKRSGSLHWLQTRHSDWWGYEIIKHIFKCKYD